MTTGLGVVLFGDGAWAAETLLALRKLRVHAPELPDHRVLRRGVRRPGEEQERHGVALRHEALYGPEMA